jgi:hypothetical protein
MMLRLWHALRLLLCWREHVVGVGRRALDAKSILHLSLLPDGGLQLICLEAFESHFLTIDALLQQSLFRLRHGL